MMEQLLAHLIGDYVLQNHWMANRKTSSSMAAWLHALTYGLPFVLLTQSVMVLSVIIGTHFVIDRWRLAGLWVNFWGTGKRGWVGEKLGVEIDDAPPWLAVWLLIIVDNTMHLTINFLALGWSST